MNILQRLRRLFRREPTDDPQSTVDHSPEGRTVWALNTRARKRMYELYSMGRTPTGLTNRYHHHLHGLHHWVFRVRAYSITQAYHLTYNETWARAPQDIGIEKVELGRGYRDVSETEAREQGLIQEAPYFRDGGRRTTPG